MYLMGGGQKPAWIGEIKWSDRIKNNKQHEIRNLHVLLENHKSITGGFVTTRTIKDKMSVNGRNISIIPSTMYCYTVGRNITARLDNISHSLGTITHEESESTRVEVGD